MRRYKTYTISCVVIRIWLGPKHTPVNHTTLNGQATLRGHVADLSRALHAPSRYFGLHIAYSVSCPVKIRCTPERAHVDGRGSLPWLGCGGVAGWAGWGVVGVAGWVDSVTINVSGPVFINRSWALRTGVTW